MAKRDRTPSLPNVSPERRLELARGAGWEMDALVDGLRDQVMKIIPAEDFHEKIVITLYLDRMRVITDSLMEVADPEDDESHDAAKLADVLRFAPNPKRGTRHD